MRCAVAKLAAAVADGCIADDVDVRLRRIPELLSPQVGFPSPVKLRDGLPSTKMNTNTNSVQGVGSRHGDAVGGTGVGGRIPPTHSTVCHW